MLHDINFTATVSEIFDSAGRKIPRELGRGVYREDNGELISICGPNFAPVQHMDVVTPIVECLEGQGYKVEERANASRGDLHDLKGQKGAWISPKITDSGAVMRTDIILGDFIEPTGATSYLDEGPDTNFFKISVLNSHNSKYAVRANTSYLRLICMNGMTQPHFTASAYGKHTANFNIQGLQAQISNAMQAMGDDADRFGVWAKTKISKKQAEQFLQMTIAKLPNKPNGDKHFSAPLVNKILGQFQREDQTLWGLYNAVTWWQTHADFRANSDRLTSAIGRESKVAAMLKSKHMTETFAI